MASRSSWLKFFSCVAMILPPLSAQASSSDVVARLQQRTVTLEELDQSGGREIYDATQQLYEARVRALYRLLSKEILAREAKTKNMSVDQLLQDRVGAPQTAMVDTDIDILLKSRAGMDANDPQIRQQAALYVAAKHRADEQRQYVAKLFDEYGVRVSLEPPATPPAEEVRGPLEPVIGNRAAPITIIAFSDYRCPYCRELSHTLGQLLERYPQDLKIVYRHFPVHPESDELGQAALCAADQGRFLQYHKALFDSNTVDRAQLTGFAEKLGLKVEEFSACLSTRKYAARVQDDLKEGQRLGIQGTPTLFVNGFRLRGAQSLQRLSAQVQEALKESKTASNSNGPRNRALSAAALSDHERKSDEDPSR